MKLCSYEPEGGKSDLAHLFGFLDKDKDRDRDRDGTGTGQGRDRDGTGTGDMDGTDRASE